MTWKAGDLGRLSNESSKQPRFEVVGVSDNNVVVWYGGDANPTRIPIDVFKKQAVKWWELDFLIPPRAWIVPGVRFYIGDKFRGNIRQAILTKDAADVSKRPVTENIVLTNIFGSTLKIRTIQRDYTSCSIEDSKLMILVPIRTIHEHGTQVRTVWDRLDEDFLEQPPDPEAELEALMKNLP